jgi:hypothetical protein
MFWSANITLSIASLALIPRGVLAATAALSISPVAKWHRQYSSLIRGDWVPFPEPGGPTRLVKGVPNSPNHEHYRIKIKTQNVVNEETKRHYDITSSYAILPYTRIIYQVKQHDKEQGYHGKKDTPYIAIYLCPVSQFSIILLKASPRAP